MRKGDVIEGRFEIAAVAGVGAMGTVYRAWDKTDEASVAIKLLHATSAQDHPRFAREAQILAELLHPGFVRYITHDATEDGQLYLVMEWLEGLTLEERLSSGKPLTVSETLALVRRAAEALGTAHHKGIIHRDIKPSNLFLVGGLPDALRILDLGIARLGGAGRRLTQTGMIVGTPGYMAPEQARGDHRITARADVFSLGCVLFECLTGQPAFNGDSIMAVLARVLLEPVPRLHDLRPDLPLALDDLLARMLCKEAEGRPADGREVVSTLDAMGLVEGGLPLPGPVRWPSLTQSEQRVVSIVVASLGGDRPGEPVASSLAPTINLDQDPVEVIAARARLASFGATVERLLDGTLIVLMSGAAALTEQAMRGAHCALTLRTMLPGSPIVLATGRGLVGDRWPVGEVIDWALAALDKAAPDVVRIDAVTAGLLDNRFIVTQQDDRLVLQGQAQAIEATRTLLGRPTRCVGRDRELSLLESQFETCASGPDASATLLTAAPGLGKSRVAYELLRRLREKGSSHVLLWSRGEALTAGSAFGLVGPLVRRAAGINGDEPIEEQRQKLAAHAALLASGADGRRLAEFLGELASVPRVDEPSLALRSARTDPLLMGDQIRAAFIEWLAAMTRQRPVVVVLDDIQWGDYPSLQLLDEALRRLADSPLMVLGLARPEVHERFPRLWAERSVTEVKLGPLTRRAARDLVVDTLGEQPEDVLSLLLERAAGNAFYLEELIRAVASGKGDTLPDSVLGTVEARLDELDPEARRVLRAASVFGQRFWSGGVASLLGRDTSQSRLDAWLDELSRRELISQSREDGLAGHTAFAFRHGLVRDAVYATLTESDRVLGHQLAAQWLTQVGDRDPLALAQHFERGQQREPAASWYREAAVDALAGNDLEGAASRALRGLSCAQAGALVGSLALTAAEALRWRGTLSEAEEHARRAVKHLTVGGHLWFQAISELILVQGRLAHEDELESCVHNLLTHAPLDEPAQRARVQALCIAATRLMAVNRHDRAQLALEEANRAVPHGLPEDPLVEARLLRARGQSLVHTGELGAAVSFYSAAASAYESVGDVRNACLQRMNVGYFQLILGQLNAARKTLETAIGQTDRLGLDYLTAFGRHNLGLVLARQGHLEQGMQVETQAAAWLDHHGDVELGAGARMYLAEILTLRGDLPAAEREARRAVELVGDTPLHRAHALACWSRIALRQGRVAEGVSAATEAWELTVPEALTEGEFDLWLSHADALEATGDTAGAHEALALARERLYHRAQRIGSVSLRQAFLSASPQHLEIMRRTTTQAESASTLGSSN